MIPAIFRWLIAAFIWTALINGLSSSVCSQVTARGSKEQVILQIQQLITEQNFREARQLLVAAAQKYPADAGFDNLRGIVEVQEGNTVAAEKYFNKAVHLAPKFTGAYLNLGRLYQINSNGEPQALSKALEVYKHVLEYEPDNAEANYQSAALFMQQGFFSESLTHLQSLPPDLQRTAQSLAIACANYSGLGNRERAGESAARLLAHPDFSGTDAQIMLPALAAGRRDDLIVLLLEELLKRAPLSPLLTHHLALAYERTGKLTEARAALEKLIDANPAVPLLVELARVAHEQKDYQGALGYLAHARDIEPVNAALHYSFGLVCLDLNLLAEARNSFAKAVQLEPENPAYNYAMGTASAFRRDPSEAIPYFEKYLKLKPQDPRGQLALGAAFFRARNYEAASAILSEAVKYSETATIAHYYLGSIANFAGRVDEARRDLEIALKAQPDYPDALAELAQTYLNQKDYPQAEKYLRRALELNPNHYAANFNLLTLYARTGDARRAEQGKRFDEIQKTREEKSQDMLRMVEIQRFPTP